VTVVVADCVAAGAVVATGAGTVFSQPAIVRTMSNNPRRMDVLKVYVGKYTIAR
jgi:hypothetical protein